MTVPAQVFKIIPRHYDIFGGLDVAKKNMAVTFTDHEALMRSLRLPYSSAHLLHYVRKHFPDRRVAFVYEAGPTGFGLRDELVSAGYRCLVVAPESSQWSARVLSELLELPCSPAVRF